MKTNTKALYAVIDLKSFYAAVECADRGLSIFDTPLVVCDASRTKATIIMSATPYLKKKYGVPNVCRWKDLPEIPDLILATPRMARYIEVSSKVVSTFLDYVDEADIHVYSIDESFLNIGPYLKAAGCSAEEFVQRIQRRIKDELGLVATAGIGPNMFMAKACLDNEGKKKPPFIATWTMDDVKTKLWAVKSPTDLWGINVGINRRLQKIGIRTVEELANAKDDLLQKEFGIIGLQLKNIANGIDESDIRQKYTPKETSLTCGQTLIEDYNMKTAVTVLREMNDDLCFRLRMAGKKTGCVGVFVGYSAPEGGGFARQTSLNIVTDDNDKIFEALMKIYNQYIENKPIKQLSIVFSKLGTYTYQQLALNEDGDKSKKTANVRKAIDKIQTIYGKNSCLRATSLNEESTIHTRHEQIGGHKA